jgi:hypothetical protein
MVATPVLVLVTSRLSGCIWAPRSKSDDMSKGVVIMVEYAIVAA